MVQLTRTVRKMAWTAWMSLWQGLGGALAGVVAGGVIWALHHLF
jgi:hypothetical protein